MTTEAKQIPLYRQHEPLLTRVNVCALCRRHGGTLVTVISKDKRELMVHTACYNDKIKADREYTDDVPAPYQRR